MNIINSVDSAVEFLERDSWFDPVFYAQHYKDVHAYPLGLARHYVNHGVNEGRLPREHSLIPTLRKAYTAFIQAGVRIPFKEDTAVQFFQWMIANKNVLSSLDTVFAAADSRTDTLLHAFSKTAHFRASQKLLNDLHQRLQGFVAFIALITAYTSEANARSALEKILEVLSQAGERDYQLIRRSGEFDDAFYLSTYADIRSAGVDPLRHYLEHGYLEGRDPSAVFSTNFYLLNNHDVKIAGLNPLLHFIVFGRGEGRTGRPSLISLPRVAATPSGNSSASQLVKALHDIAQNLDRYEAVSFDFFDTLVQRRIADPHAVFSSMQQHEFIRDRSGSFRTLRVEAEARARARGRAEVTIEEIYEELPRISSFSNRDIPDLVRLEQEYELATLSPRPLGIELLAQARIRGMKIIIASDFYFGEPFIRRVMQQVGIDADEIAILVSSEHRCTKHEGGMFDLVAATLKVAENRILHVGDNHHSDYLVPLSKGIAAACLPPTKKAFSAHGAIDFYVQAQGAEAGSLYSSLALDRRTDMVVATPLTEAADFGYKILGPVILAYCQFLKQLAKVQNVDNLLFLSRDTRLVHDAFAALQDGSSDAPSSDYILVSRQAIFGATANDIHAVGNIVARDYAELSFMDLLRDRFLFDGGDIEALLAEHPWLRELEHFDVKGPPSHTREPFLTAAMAIFESIKRVSARRRQAYDIYLQSTLRSGAKSLLVDIGYRGTTQIAFSQLFGKSMNGAYFMTWREIDKVAECGLGAWAFAPFASGLQKELTKFVSMLELVFSDPNAPTLRCFEERGAKAVPVFGGNDLTPGQTGYLTEAHRHAIAFCEDAKSSAGLVSLSEAERYEVCAPLLRFFHRPARHFKQTFGEAVFEDKFGGASQRLLGGNR